MEAQELLDKLAKCLTVKDGRIVFKKNKALEYINNAIDAAFVRGANTADEADHL